MKKSLTLTAFLALQLFSFLLMAQHGTPNWNPSVDLAPYFNGNNIQGALYSNMGVLPNDKRVILINKTSGSVQGAHFISSLDGITWTSAQPFNPPNSGIGVNSVKLNTDAQGRIHLLWQSSSPTILYYSQYDSSLAEVIDTVRIADQPAYGSFKGMYNTIDAQGRIHVMWHEGDTKTAGDIPECYYSKSTDGGLSFSPKVALSDTSDGKPSAFPRGQFAAYAGDSLLITWRDFVSDVPDDWDLQYVLSANGGDSWSANPLVLDSDPGYQGDPDLVIAPNGDFHIFSHEAPQSNQFNGMRVVYRKSADFGSTWTSEVNVSSSIRCLLPEGSRYDPINDLLWTFFKEEGSPPAWSGDIMATYSGDAGTTWSSPEYLTDADTIIIRFKAISFLNDGTPIANVEIPTANDYPNSGTISVHYVERSNIPISSDNHIPQTNQLLISPNPTQQKVKIETTGMGLRELCLLNSSGKALLRQSIIDTRTEIEFDLQNFPSGLYFIQVSSENKVWVEKIIKQ